MSEKTILWIVIIGCITINLIVSEICNCIKYKKSDKKNDFENQNKNDEKQNESK